eukprot:TRINITY_DN62326_c0_g1_i1.p1 TRINITY_DN62326_c0_g1~~TRINITY_DN62326_c0_g1_i1.p1  ORF type:complete len:329 (-),score=65.64 TRINITY_DN62326_c0_g1_i1:82-1038(-)
MRRALHGLRPWAADRCRSLQVARRSVACLASAPAGNLVRFLAPDGQEHWGSLLEPGQGARRARLFKGVPSPSSTALSEEEAEIASVLAPLPVDPSPAVIIMGLNYRSHAAETGSELPRFPVFAFKNPASVIGPDVPISIPKVAREKPEVDFEAELAIVLGRKVRDASPEEGLSAVLGVTGSNDVSARRWQGKKGGGQWSRAKSFDTFCPLGPSLLPLYGPKGVAEALAPGGSGLRVCSWVNGKAMQDGNTSDMEFGIAAVVSYLSQGTTLLPGTVILTGTPPGVGYVRKPPVYLAPGDLVEVELGGAGKLSNPVEAGP